MTIAGYIIPSKLRRLAVAAALGVIAALVAAPSTWAHPGHHHNTRAFDGRMPGQPDYQTIDGVTTRFDPKSRTYFTRRPGEPPMEAHVEGDQPPPPEGADALGAFYPLPPSETAPACATAGHRIVVVRAYDQGTGTPNEEDEHIRSLVGRMNWKFMQQSQLSSQGSRILRMKVHCTVEGAVDVRDIEVPFGHIGPGVDTTDGDISVQDTISYVQNTLGQPGNANAVKYLIFNDRARSGFVGIGYLWRDPDKSSSDTYVPGAIASPAVNMNRVGTTSALFSRNPNYTVDGRDSWESGIPVHELLHVMNSTFWSTTGDPSGWVSAPYANTGFHCVDGIDILCYSSGTSAEGPYTETRCPASAGYGSAEGVAIDCEFDTYFDSQTETGEWLASWWNVGGAENPFLHAMEAVDLDLASSQTGRLDLVATTTTGTLRYRYRTSEGWSAWQELGGSLASAPVLVSPGPGKSASYH